jgi:hypothetical protein
MVVDGMEGFVGSREAVARQEIARAAAIKKTRIEISEISPDEARSVAFKVSVERLSTIAPRDTAEIVLAITASGLHSALKGGDDSGEELRHSPVVRELKVIGVMGKNGEEGFQPQRAVKLDANWTLENLRADVFVQEKKPAHSGSCRGSGIARYGVALKNKETSSNLDHRKEKARTPDESVLF